MSVIKASVGFWAPVTFVRPGDDLKPDITKFRVRYKRMKKSEREAQDLRLSAATMTAAGRADLEKRVKDEKTPTKERDSCKKLLDATPIYDDEFLNTMVIDWELTDPETGTPLIYSIQTRKEMEEEFDGLSAVLVKSYFEAVKQSTNLEAIAKNSVAQSSTT